MFYSPVLVECRDAVQLSACRGKLWESRPNLALGPLSVSLPFAPQKGADSQPYWQPGFRFA